MEEEKKLSQVEIIKKQVKILSGFYPTFLYYTVKSNETIQNVIMASQKLLNQYKIPFEKIKQQHLTVTRTISVLQSQIKGFVQKIRKTMKNAIQTESIILLFKKVIILQNFICIQVQKVTHDKLYQVSNSLRQIIPNPYFEKPIYHISIIKILTKINQNIQQQINAIKIQPKISSILQRLMIKAGSKEYEAKVNK